LHDCISSAASDVYKKQVMVIASQLIARDKTKGNTGGVK
ncbi:hypothetical protein NUU24_26405, partial [Escherichia coli]